MSGLLAVLLPALHRDDEAGQGMVEYALILVLVSLVVIAALMVLGPKAANFFYYAGNSINF